MQYNYCLFAISSLHYFANDLQYCYRYEQTLDQGPPGIRHHKYVWSSAACEGVLKW